MCRLLGYAASAPLTLAELLGEPDLSRFTQLACKHGDGWGFARAGAGVVEVVKAPDSARLSPEFDRLVHQQSADLAMVHLRWATLGLPVAQRNAHPFTNGQVAFAHNGSIRPPASLEPLLSKQVMPLLQGETDSERFFLAVLSHLGVATDVDAVVRACAAAVHAVTSTLTYSSLNSMLITPNHLYALCAYDPKEELKEDEPEYYRLRHRRTATSVVVSSSGWGSGWESLENGQLLVVERATLRTSIHSLSSCAARA